ncbi:hypothetical protein B0T24DRAFT_589457 [Lasiosphaeria ovina]|uniref:Uncharacterized protein n=1 Tax=Lasiosphaeria ovina TaxID=92902 RepID=A0AAE0NCY7_9PEZI|nr:hypothetical protein B0T24DRAFT_589457 [Lasiosphaeria ovina]
MSILVPLPKSGFTAIYYSNIETLKVFASGDIPGWIIDPQLERDHHFVGGLKFLLRGFAGGYGIKPAQSLHASIEVEIDLPNAPIHTSSVTCESADGSFDIPVTTDDQKVEYPPAGSNLISLAKGSFHADYDTSTKTLTVFAKGDVAGWILGPQLYRDTNWFGGLKFDLRGYSGGLGRQPTQHLEASIAIEIFLPQEDFQSRVVTFQTEDGASEIPIVYYDVNKDSDAATGQKEPTPGSILVPLPESGFKAVYVTKTLTLTVSAVGKVPGWILDPHLEHDVLFGGLKFSLRGFPGGISEAPEQVIDTSIKLQVGLPAEHFESDTVTCQSETGTYHIKINYAGLDGQSKDS